MNNLSVNIWLEETKHIKKIPGISLPLQDFLDEASIISGFLEKYWDGTMERPGLSAAQPIVERTMGAEIEMLIREIGIRHSEGVKLEQVGRGQVSIGQSARQWIREMQHFLKWAQKQHELGNAKALTEDIRSLNRKFLKDTKDRAALGNWITTYLKLADENLKTLAIVPGFSGDFLQVGRDLKTQLTQIKRGRPKGSSERQRVMDERRRLTYVLMERVKRVRCAARFVFRNHPDIRRQATSEFERKRRQKNREKSQKRKGDSEKGTTAKAVD